MEFPELSAGSNGRTRPSTSHPDRHYVSMAERMEQRKQRRHELEMRYECARKQQEVCQSKLFISYPCADSS